MNILCLWSPEWRTGGELVAELTPLVLEEAPRVVVEGRGVAWVDVGGLPASSVAKRLVSRLRGGGGRGWWWWGRGRKVDSSLRCRWISSPGILVCSVCWRGRESRGVVSSPRWTRRRSRCVSAGKVGASGGWRAGTTREFSFD